MHRNTQIPACIWFLTKNKKARTTASGINLCDRSGQVLFIDARNLGYMKDRVLRDFTQEDLNKVSDTYHAWQTTTPLVPTLPRGNADDTGIAAQDMDSHGGPWEPGAAYVDVAGFCNSATLEMITKHDYVLTPGRYVGAAEEQDDGEPFADKMTRLTAQLKTQFEESDRLEAEIKKNLAGLGYEC